MLNEQEKLQYILNIESEMFDVINPICSFVKKKIATFLDIYKLMSNNIPNNWKRESFNACAIMM